jgi:hypothetical protein
MKKFVCVCVVLALCVSFCGCNKPEQSNTKVSSPLVEVNTIYDDYGNLIQQTVYNELTGEYTTTIFTYAYGNNGIWVCVDQKCVVTGTIKTNDPNLDNTLSIFFQNDFANKSVVLLDNDEVKVSIIEVLDKASWWDFGYKIMVENRTDKTLSFIFSDLYIMSISCSPMFTVDHVVGNSTAYFTLAWDEDSLKRACIPYIDNIEFMLRVYSTDDYCAPADYGIRALIKN